MNRVYDLKCDNAVNLLGLDHRNPLFSWKIAADGENRSQSAYQILVSQKRENLQSGQGDLWDSGKLCGEQSCGVPYAGKPLESRKMYYWTVLVWLDGGDGPLVGEIQYFETALLYESDFFANWIGFGPALEGECLYIRRDFVIERELEKAVSYTSGLGIYELYINGKKCADTVLAPTVSTPSKSIYYNRNDITGFLQKGKNTIAVILGNGWSDALKFWAQIYLDYQDGTQEVLFSDWAQGWTGRPGSVRQSLYGGEMVHTEEEIENWMLPEYDLKKYYEQPQGFIQLGVKEAPGGVLRCEMLEPIRVTEVRTPVPLEGKGQNAVIYDTGQNLSGWIHFDFYGDKGDAITVLYAESLSEDGRELNRANLRFAKARNIIYCSGREDSYRPKFSYHGFRYFQIITEGNAKVKNIRVEIVRNDIEQIGTFECSDGLLNQFQKAVLWTEKTNQHGIPTDCPQRDERMGWLNDVTSRSTESFFNFDMARFYRKWMTDIADTVDEKSGAYADTAPYFWGFRPADTASNAYILLGLQIYQLYGDKENLRAHYQNMKGWILYQLATEKDHQIVPSYYGDWASPQTECGADTDSGAQSVMTTGAYLSMADFCRSLLWMADIAGILGLDEEKKFYQKNYGIFRQYTNELFYRKEEGFYDKGSQTSNAAALLFGIVPEEEQQRVLDHLIADIEKHEYHFTTGNQGTKILLDTLIAFGHPEIAYRLLTQKTYPGFLHMLLNGATTMQERWETDSASTMNSMNHPMHASNGAFLYELLAGINWYPDTVGMDRFRISPYIPEDISYVKASYRSVKGDIVSEWRKEDGKILYHFVIPVNSRAEIVLTDCEGNHLKKVLGSGDYTFIA